MTTTAYWLAAQGQNVTVDGEVFVDPTRPLFWTQSAETSVERVLPTRIQPSNYLVSFVRTGSRSPIAVVNEQRVTIGDVIGGATVVEIDRSGIILEIGEERARISLYSTNIKGPAASRD